MKEEMRRVTHAIWLVRACAAIGVIGATYLSFQAGYMAILTYQAGRMDLFWTDMGFLAIYLLFFAFWLIVGIYAKRAIYDVAGVVRE